ncbi:MAG TPA: 2-oxoacid:acceptor oxidoreductase family protein [Terriglobales bacterium]|nr:2-oxoacid:acceptor oxidoreductase family protein [Terriglobales bacterium]
MLAIRFHGRGGQGAKTASRIVGTAAFLEGYQAQDSPVYGAERRGAPVSAFTRIAREPIRERGLVASPNLVVVADASLIPDSSARVSEGVDERTAVFVNSPLDSESLRAQTSLPGRLMTLDLNEIALRHFGKRGAISALLGAVSGKCIGLRPESIRDAIARELTELGLPPSVIESNQTVALHCYEAVQPVAVETVTPRPAAPASLHVPAYEPPTRGTASITAGPNSPIRSMSGWRTFRPVLRPDLCNGCWLCFANCPEGAITIKPDGKPAIYYPHCKGCLDCVEVCPTDAMTVERESEAAKPV